MRTAVFVYNFYFTMFRGKTDTLQIMKIFWNQGVCQDRDGIKLEL